MAGASVETINKDCHKFVLDNILMLLLMLRRESTYSEFCRLLQAGHPFR